MSAQARLVDLASGATAAEWMALSSAAHWNQTEDDWRTMLALGHGWGLRCDDAGRDTLVASTLVLPYAAAGAGRAAGEDDGIAWISMVLVLPAWRGRGFAERLLRVALDDLAAARLVPVLDATPAGRPVYAKLGFAEGWSFTRWRRRAAPLSLSSGTGEGAAPAAREGLRPLREDDWPAIERLDAPAFGASRLPLLHALARRLPQAASVVARAGARGEPAGYLLGRDGRTAVQFGPLVADDEATARALLDAAIGPVAALAATRGLDVIADVRDGREALAQWLQQHGFAAERPFTRMVHGGGAAPGEPARIMLPAGAELG